MRRRLRHAAARQTIVLCVPHARVDVRGLQVAQAVHSSEGAAGATWDVQSMDKGHQEKLFPAIARIEKSHAASFAEVDGSIAVSMHARVMVSFGQRFYAGAMF